ncbi:MAG TPA: 4a-hydroxytetrahydrobiopterin dehydratase [Egibacteraceae bacterium]|nr:4a-hydroxytetrahydrobiopterin dehydratase [Egibacteraceae bacterium]
MVDRLNPDALFKGLNELPGWDGTLEGISKTYLFGDDDAAHAFLDRVSVLADQMNHHPDVTRDGSTVTLALVTHSEGGVTQKDLDLAARIDTGEAHGDANPDNPAAGRRETPGTA